MDSSNMNSSTPSASSSSSYQDPISSFFDPLPSYLPTFRSSSPHQPPPPTPPPTSSSSSTPTSSKKRPRASRRAPTTVLTTDPSNFRAMVQEFTGFPSSSSLPFLPRPLLHPLPSRPFPPPSLADAIASTVITTHINVPHRIHDPNNTISINTTAGTSSYPFLNPTTMFLSAAPQFGDLGGLVVNASNSQGLRQPHAHLGGRVAGDGGALPGWEDHQFGDQSSSGDRDHDQLRPEKRQKASDVNWIHSSDH